MEYKVLKWSTNCETRDFYSCGKVKEKKETYNVIYKLLFIYLLIFLRRRYAILLFILFLKNNNDNLFLFFGGWGGGVWRGDKIIVQVNIYNFKQRVRT